jgi:hypothetical protein
MIHRWEDVKRKRLGAAQIAEVEAAAERDVWRWTCEPCVKLPR